MAKLVDKEMKIEELVKKVDFDKMQCAHCHGPACNTPAFLEKQLFCWEKVAKKWKPLKGVRVCEAGTCFIGVDNNEMVEQNCGDCPPKYKDCVACSDTDMCNVKVLLPSTMTTIIKK
uniref:Pacifastin domain-containing protein n=1 Tax=Meloidogyne hapla TaxID=6305 RepID=A0A1I8B644_MELHA